MTRTFSAWVTSGEDFVAAQAALAGRGPNGLRDRRDLVLAGLVRELLAAPTSTSPHKSAPGHKS